ncbi:hypothetical protein MMC30_000421 [Trapelia coarctata]|nr:hypothetical protein [Trapelia coarctata]
MMRQGQYLDANHLQSAGQHSDKSPISLLLDKRKYRLPANLRHGTCVVNVRGSREGGQPDFTAGLLYYQLWPTMRIAAKAVVDWCVEDRRTEDGYEFHTMVGEHMVTWEMQVRYVRKGQRIDKEGWPYKEGNVYYASRKEDLNPEIKSNKISKNKRHGMSLRGGKGEEKSRKIL